MVKRLLGFFVGVFGALAAVLAFFKLRDRVEITEQVNEARAKGRERNAESWAAIDAEAEKIGATVEEVGTDRQVLAEMLDE